MHYGLTHLRLGEALRYVQILQIFRSISLQLRCDDTNRYVDDLPPIFHKPQYSRLGSTDLTVDMVLSLLLYSRRVFVRFLLRML